MKLRKERGPWALAYGPAEVDSSNPTLTNDEAHKMLRSYVSFTGSILYSGNLPFKQCSSSACQFLGTCHSSDAAPRHAVSGNLPFKRCSSSACSFCPNLHGLFSPRWQFAANVNVLKDTSQLATCHSPVTRNTTSTNNISVLLPGA